MRLSIWQQFSSNHSGSFTVVGRFATEDAARTAAEMLREIIQRIDAWYDDPANEEQIEKGGPTGLRILSPVEAEVKQEYDLEWEFGDQGVDWYGDGHEPVIQFNQDVILDVGETWCLPQTVSELLTKLGGQTYAEHYFGAPITSITVQLSCHFTDKARAAQVHETILQWHQTTDGEDPPWTDEEYAYAQIERVSHNSNLLMLKMTYGINTLPSLRRWLEASGGDDIHYTFETVHHTE